MNIGSIFCLGGSMESVIVGLSIVCGIAMLALLVRIVLHAQLLNAQNLQKVAENRHKIETKAAMLQSRVASTQFLLSHFVGDPGDVFPDSVRHLH